MINLAKSILKKIGLFFLIKNLKIFLIRKYRPRFDLIYGDVTNICNLRCPHCYNDWDDPFLSKPIFISKKHFQKIIPLIPLAADKNFHFSCAFEPSLHPEFTDLISMIPFPLQKNVLFTTNLTTKITDETLQLLSQSNLRYINISIESFKSEIYEMSRKNGKFTRFIDNLERFAFYFSKNPKSPPIRFITLASKLNANEIPSIIENCSTKFHASEHEIRGFWSTRNNEEWVNKHKLTITEWHEMERKLENLPYKYIISNPFKESELIKQNIKNPSRKLWIQSNGIVRIEYRDKNTTINLDDIDNTYKYFKNELKKLK